VLELLEHLPARGLESALGVRFVPMPPAGSFEVLLPAFWFLALDVLVTT